MKTIEVKTSRSYAVMIEEGILSRAGVLAAPLIQGRRAAIVSDSNVWPLYGQSLRESLQEAGFQVVTHVFPAGEEHKNLGTLSGVLTFLAQRQLTRSDVLFALGGGVTGDMGGLAAALYLRGIACVQIPTTLLAMVDSSVGGKTAVDLPEGKNLVGVFSQPHLVLCDPGLLGTLDPAVYAEGFAEIIKYGMICDDGLLTLLREFRREAGSAQMVSETHDAGKLAELTEVIARCVAIKRDIVTADEHDHGKRQLLNFGHTIGHAVERCSRYSLYHGEGVAIGMAVVTRGCVRQGLCPPACEHVLADLLTRYDLPQTTEYGAEALMEAARMDKKRRGENITVILPERVGQCRLHTADHRFLWELLLTGRS